MCDILYERKCFFLSIVFVSEDYAITRTSIDRYANDNNTQYETY